MAPWIYFPSACSTLGITDALCFLWTTIGLFVLPPVNPFVIVSALCQIKYCLSYCEDVLMNIWLKSHVSVSLLTVPKPLFLWLSKHGLFVQTTQCFLCGLRWGGNVCHCVNDFVLFGILVVGLQSVKATECSWLFFLLFFLLPQWLTSVLHEVGGLSPACHWWCWNCVSTPVCCQLSSSLHLRAPLLPP